MHPVTRHLTILFTDIKGFTDKTSQRSRSKIQELLDRHREIVLPVLEGRGGKLIKTIGDAFLMIFESPTDAVLAGVDVQEALARHNAEAPEDDRIEVRVYKVKMGEMEGRFKEVFINPPIAIVQFIGGFFRLPYIYYSNKKYENDPKYRKEVDRIEKERLDAELARKKAIRDELNAYIQKDLEKEPALVKEPEVVEIKTEEVKIVPEKGEEVIVKEEIKEPKASAETSLDVNASVAVEPEEPAVAEKVVAEPVTKEKIATEPVVPVDKIAAEPVVEKSETTSQVIEKTVKPQAQSPVVIIIAKPTKGYSPLRVKFYGHKSYSRGSRIVNYQWDFGDGTTSNKKDFVNTYWSVSYGSRNFPVTLTVTDNHGNTATATTVIEVKSK